jgi:hypothetical protein
MYVIDIHDIPVLMLVRCSRAQPRASVPVLVSFYKTDTILILHACRYTQVFEQLRISPDMESVLARIADVRQYAIPGACIAREFQEV